MDALSTLAAVSTGSNRIGLFDLNGLKTYDLKSRPSKVFVEDLGHPLVGDATLSEWLDALPRHGAGGDFCRVRERICQASREGRSVVVALGGRAVESGCGPYVADWVRRGIVHAIVMSGAAAIHDFELALAGKTCEDVAEQLACGRYGMARDTADAFAVAARAGAANETGLGSALGRHMQALNCPYAEASPILAALHAGIPCSIHVSLGAEAVHMHPHVCAAALGEASMIDFRRLCSVVSMLANGVWLNIGSAASLPETLLKAMAVVRNFGHAVDGLLTVNIDHRRHDERLHRPLEQCGSECVSLTGNPELMLPLLHAAVACRLESPTIRSAQAA